MKAITAQREVLFPLKMSELNLLQLDCGLEILVDHE